MRHRLRACIVSMRRTQPLTTGQNENYIFVVLAGTLSILCPESTQSLSSKNKVSGKGVPNPYWNIPISSSTHVHYCNGYMVNNNTVTVIFWAFGRYLLIIQRNIPKETLLTYLFVSLSHCFIY